MTVVAGVEEISIREHAEAGVFENCRSGADEVESGLWLICGWGRVMEVRCFDGRKDMGW